MSMFISTKKPGSAFLALVASLLVMCFTVLSPFSAKADTETVVPEISDQMLEIANIAATHLTLDADTGLVVIQDATDLISEIGTDNYNELVITTEQINDAVQTFQGARYKKDLIQTVNMNNMENPDMSGCAKATIAGTLHVAAFTGLMTIAGVSGPFGWALGLAVTGVWLGAQAAAGCLK